MLMLLKLVNITSSCLACFFNVIVCYIDTLFQRFVDIYFSFDEFNVLQSMVSPRKFGLLATRLEATFHFYSMNFPDCTTNSLAKSIHFAQVIHHAIISSYANYLLEAWQSILLNFL